MQGTPFSGFVLLDPAASPGASDQGDLDAAFREIASGRSAVLRLRPDLADADIQAVRTFLEQVVRLTDRLEPARQEAAIAKLAEVILPDDAAATRSIVAIDNLAIRDRFLAEVPCLTSSEIATSAGHALTNPYATAARWRRSGSVFSVSHRGTEYFPAFQFRDGRPHPCLRAVLAALPATLSPWQRAFWFVSANGWLDDAKPADRLHDCEALIRAAGMEATEVYG